MERLDEAGITAGLAGLDWQRDGDSIVKVHTLGDFAEALGYVNAVGAVAEARNHHPDIDIRWNRVSLRLSTHSAGGLTQADFDLAGVIDRLSGRAG